MRIERRVLLRLVVHHVLSRVRIARAALFGRSIVASFIVGGKVFTVASAGRDSGDGHRNFLRCLAKNSMGSAAIGCNVLKEEGLHPRGFEDYLDEAAHEFTSGMATSVYESLLADEAVRDLKRSGR